MTEMNYSDLLRDTATPRDTRIRLETPETHFAYPYGAENTTSAALSPRLGLAVLSAVDQPWPGKEMTFSLPRIEFREVARQNN